MTMQRSRGCWRGAGQCSGSRWHHVGSVYFCTCGPWWFPCSSQRDFKPKNSSHMIQYHHCPFTTTVCVREKEIMMIMFMLFVFLICFISFSIVTAQKLLMFCFKSMEICYRNHVMVAPILM